MTYTIAKEHKHGHFYEAVVMDENNKVLFRSGLGFNKTGKALCETWIHKQKSGRP